MEVPKKPAARIPDWAVFVTFLTQSVVFSYNVIRGMHLYRAARAGTGARQLLVAVVSGNVLLLVDSIVLLFAARYYRRPPVPALAEFLVSSGVWLPIKLALTAGYVVFSIVFWSSINEKGKRKAAN